ncbi:ABC transporter permease [Geminicoccaceae bacterium 1502E]|nr:ABC transporter permease [Geminicoccaceae bacterium 1502E]
MFTSRTTGLMLVLPAVVFIAVGFLAPVLILLAQSLRLEDGWGIGNYLAFMNDGLGREVFWRTIKLAALVTLAAAVIGYVAAWAIVETRPERRGVLVGMVILPLMISPVARTYAWLVILGRTGFLNVLITNLGLSEEPLRLLFTETAVFIGLLQLFLPLMIISLVSALENLPRDVVPAAQTLGAGWIATFFKVILPLTREGLVIGGTLVFTGSVTAYITPAVLGGSKVLMLETLLYQRVSVANDFASASVIAAILMVTTLAANRLLRRLATPRRR